LSWPIKLSAIIKFDLKSVYKHMKEELLLSIKDNRGFEAKILADSITKEGHRLTTIEATFPRLILSEFNTHRDFSRNSASSRAIPFWKQLQKIISFGYIPSKLGINQAGMQASVFLYGEKLAEAQAVIKLAKDRAIISTVEMILGRSRVEKALGEAYESVLVNGFSNEEYALILDAVKDFEALVKESKKDGKLIPEDYINLHKQHVNRYLEPYMWHTVVVTASEWGNWDALRISEMAQPEIDAIARMITYLRAQHTPTLLQEGEWHLPLIQEDELHLVKDDIELWKKVSVGRCARVSYETHDGKRDTSKDVSLAEILLNDGHMSPWEHVATPQAEGNWDPKLGGNFKGWVQLRKTIPGEADFSSK
jgi:thymidylate synthase ThyX